MEETTTIHAFRLKPGQDLKIVLQDFVNAQHIEAGWIITCVGSLTQSNLRFANQQAGQKGNGFFEIICLSGTLSMHGCHLHMAIADSNGSLIGGHLLDGCIVYTTAEIVIGASKDLVFTRENDLSTEWNELQIRRKNSDESSEQASKI